MNRRRTFACVAPINNRNCGGCGVGVNSFSQRKNMAINCERQPSVFYNKDSNSGIYANPSQLNYGSFKNEHHLEQVSNNFVPHNNSSISNMNQLVPELQLSQPGLHNSPAQNVYFSTPKSFLNQHCVRGQTRLRTQPNYLSSVDHSYIVHPRKFEDRRPQVQQVQLVSKVELEKPIQQNVTSNILKPQAQPQLHTTKTEPWTFGKTQGIEQLATPNSKRITEPYSETLTYREQPVRPHRFSRSFSDDPNGRAVTTWNTVRYEPLPARREVVPDRIAPIYNDINKSTQPRVTYEAKADRETSSVPYEEQRPQAMPFQLPTNQIVHPRGYRVEAEPTYEQSLERSFDIPIQSRLVKNPRSKNEHSRSSQVPNELQQVETTSQVERNVIARLEQASPLNPNNAERKHNHLRPRGLTPEVKSAEAEYKALAPSYQDEVQVDTFEPVEEIYNGQHREENDYGEGRSRREPRSRAGRTGPCCFPRKRRKKKRRKQSVRTYRDE